jgi:alginate O-acetyltransferase complex protein AlgI
VARRFVTAVGGARSNSHATVRRVGNILFSELNFWAFFAVVFALYLLLPHRGQNWLLLVASYVFYGAWDWRFLFLIFFSTSVDFIVTTLMYRETSDLRRKHLLWISLAINLGILGTFKYLGFFVESVTRLLTDLGLAADPVVLSIILPVGVSFFTFQSLSYTIDVYNRKLTPITFFPDLALFVAFFPQLVAGPIERASHMLPQIVRPREVTWEGLGRGAVLCLTGLIKKIVVADGIAPVIDAIYTAPDPSGADVIVATWLFALQIYCDFSGYTDIARGVARMMGFELMLNFAQPYFVTNPQSFWRRWHISLSTWLRDYLYIPLGGSRKGTARTYFNLMATMVIGGFWHGAAWNFILWGVYQGALLCLFRPFVNDGAEAGGPHGPLPVLWRVIRIALFFQVVCYGWLLFRSHSLAQIVDFTLRILTVSPAQFASLGVPELGVPVLLGIGFVLIWDLFTELAGSRHFYLRWPVPVRSAVYASMIYLLAFGATTPSGTFIYFQF